MRLHVDGLQVMGASTRAIERPRRGGAIKCEFCGRSVVNVQALRKHQISLHSAALKLKQKGQLTKSVIKKLHPKSKITLIKKTVTKGGKDTSGLKITAVKAKAVSKGVKTSTATKMGGDKQNENSGQTEIGTGVSKAKTAAGKTLFKCPKCDKTFSMLFSAQRHVKKHYSEVNSDGKTSLSPKALEPVALEQCQYCCKTLPISHDCPKYPKPGIGLKYKCAGCEETYNSSKLFDQHVNDVHGEGCATIMFPNEAEFRTWCTQLQTESCCVYHLMGRYYNKSVYRCTELSAKGNNIDSVLQCPSLFICTQLPTGCQVQFFEKHYQHTHVKYHLSESLKSYSINDLIQQAGGDMETDADDSDLYLQFKTLMDSIVLEAAKINIDTLKILISQAVQMTNILKQYDEDDDFVANTSAASNIITTQPKESEVVEPGGDSATKRKSAGVKEEKRPQNTFSLANDKDSDKILQELDADSNKTNAKRSKVVKSEEVEEKVNIPRPGLVQSPSFNDSYKEFVDKTIKEKVVCTTAPRRQRMQTKPMSKMPVKTKIGQFKPSLSPKKRISFGKKKDVEYEVKERENDCNILILKI